MRICVLGAASSPHVLARARAFGERGHQVTLISPTAPEPHEPESSPLTILWPKPHRAGFAGKIGLVLWTAWMLTRQRADVYHAHYAAEVGSWLAWLLRRQPLVVTVMGGDVLFDEQGSLGPLGRWLTRQTVMGARLVTTKSRHLTEVIARIGVPTTRIEEIIWGIDAAVFRFSAEGRASTRRDWNVADDSFLVFSPRMMMPFYNIDLLVEAWAKIADTEPNTLLVLSEYRADPAYRDTLKRRVKELGLERCVRFVPARTPDRMADAYSAADVVVSIPPSDGFPQTVLEAAACGRPVILSDLPRLYDILAPETCALYAGFDPAAIAAAVKKTMKNPSNTRERAEKAREAVLARADFQANVDRVEGRLLALVRTD